jgi:hypothetical protein
MRRTTFLILTSSDAKWILNKNSEKLLGLSLNRICWNFFLGLQIFMKLGPRVSVCTLLPTQLMTKSLKFKLVISCLGLEGLN